MAQQFLAGVYRRRPAHPAARRGAARRARPSPAPGEFRANIGRGASVEVADLDDADRRVVETLAPALRADGLWLVGIDVIDGRLSEVNVTSPTGLRQLTRLSGGRPDLRVVDWLAERSGAGAEPGGGGWHSDRSRSGHRHRLLERAPHLAVVGPDHPAARPHVEQRVESGLGEQGPDGRLLGRGRRRRRRPGAA